MTPRKITIQIKSVYGELKVYPVCDDAKLFAAIAGTKTLTHATLCLVERLGFTIETTSNAITWKEI